MFDQDFTFDPGDDMTVRHLTSVRLIDVAPVTTPAYLDASCGLRSLAAQFDADPDDVFALAKDSELRKLFTRNDNSSGPTMTGRQALIKFMELDPNAKRPIGLTSAQARFELTRTALPSYDPIRQAAERAEQLEELRIPYLTADASGLAC
ncbi:MAG: HK97 family phage prohead protease, partial [Mycobacterium sp.]